MNHLNAFFNKLLPLSILLAGLLILTPILVGEEPFRTLAFSSFSGAFAWVLRELLKIVSASVSRWLRN